MTNVNIQSLKAMNEFGELFVKVTQNLVNATEYAEGVIVPQAQASGSPVLEAVAQDVTSVKEASQVRLGAAKALSQSMEEYTAQISKVNAN